MPGPKPYDSAEGGGANPPYGEDIFQHLKAVHWPKKEEEEITTGLAVEFGEGSADAPGAI